MPCRRMEGRFLRQGMGIRQGGTMSLASENFAWQLETLREDYGTPVALNGVIYPMHTERVAGANVGTQTLAYSTLGPFIASDDPRVFRLSPHYFQPFTEVVPPQGPRRLEDGTIETDILQY